MSKNFRSSFIDLLCCRYSKRRLLTVTNNSSRNRRVTESYKHLHPVSRPTDFKVRSSVVSHFSQLNPITGISNTTGDTGYSSSSRLTAELIPKYDQKEAENEENNNIPLDYPSSCHITVGTQTSTLNKTHRRRKHSDRSPVVAYCSLPTKSTTKTSAVLCT